MKLTNVYKVSLVLAVFVLVCSSASWADWNEVFFDDFDDGDYDGWTVTNWKGEPRPAPDVVPSPEGYSLRGVGSGYSTPPPVDAWISHPVSISDVTELKIEMRAKSGPQWPNRAAVYLVSSSDYYGVDDYGEAGENETADLYFYINGLWDFLHRYPIGSRAFEWHTFAWTRDANGWWSLSIDGQVEAANFCQDNRLTSFDRVGIMVMRNQSEIEWVRISVGETEPPETPFFDDFEDLSNWEDYYRPAEFGCEEIGGIGRHVLLLKAGQGASGKTTSQVTTKEFWEQKGTFAAYVQFNDPGQNGIFEDINVQDVLAINRDHFNIPEEDYCEVDFEWLTCKYWDGTQADILQLNSWDTKDDEDDNADPNQFPIPVGGLNLDGKWVLLLFQVHDDGNLKFFLDYELLPYPESIDTRFRPDNDMQIELSNWFNNESNDPTERTYTMKVDWVYYSSEILDPSDVWDKIEGLRAPPCNPAMCIKATCPVDLIVTDPDGLQTCKRVNNISGAIYIESDINGDGDPDDIVTISETLPGCYLIKVVSEAGASPTDTFTLVVNRDGITRVLAQDVQIQDIPEFPFVVTTLDSLSADMEIDPETLNLSSKSNWITCYIQFPEAYYVANIDSSTILLNGEIPPARLFAGDEQDIEQILMVKFDRSALQKIIELGNVDLIVTGELFDGTPFECTDTIRVIDKGGKK